MKIFELDDKTRQDFATLINFRDLENNDLMITTVLSYQQLEYITQFDSIRDAVIDKIDDAKYLIVKVS